MEMYSKAVREMHPQFEQREPRRMGKYIGRLANYYGGTLGVVGCSRNGLADLEPYRHRRFRG